MTDIFISYSRKDKTFVQRLFALLEQQGHDAWVDWDDIEYAEDWWHKIQRGIAEADNFVFIMSPHSVRSKVCFDEIQYAEDTHKRIIPVVIADIDDPVDQERMHPALKRHNWLHFRPDDDFEAVFATLLATVQRDPEHVRQHTRLLVNAQEWQSANQNNSRLLRGDNLRQAETWLQLAAAKEPEPTTLHRDYIAASQRAEKSGQRRTLSAGVTILAVVTVLTVAALVLFQQNQRAEQVQASIRQAEDARSALANGLIFDALPLAVEAAELNDPPAEAIATLREIAGAPGPMALFISDSPVTTVAFSPDRTRIIAGYADGAVRLWDATAGVGEHTTPLYMIPQAEWHSEGVNAVDIHPQGQYVASASCGQRDPDITDGDTCIQPEVYLWELVGDELRRRNRLDSQDEDREVRSEPFDLAFSPDTTGGSIAHLGVGFGGSQSFVELRYRLDEAGNVEQPWVGFSRSGFVHNSEMITAIAYSRYNELISGDVRGRLRYAQGLGGIGESLSVANDVPTGDIAYSPVAPTGVSSTRMLLGYTDGQVIVRSRNEVLNRLNLSSAVNSLAYSPDGGQALVALEDGRLVLLNTADNATVAGTLRWQPDTPFSAVDYGDHNTGDTAYPDFAVSGSADGTIILWDAAFTDLNTDDYPDVPALRAWLAEHRYGAETIE